MTSPSTSAATAKSSAAATIYIHIAVHSSDCLTHRINRIWEREEIYILRYTDGRSSIGNVPPEPAIWITIITTATALPMSPNESVSEYTSNVNTKLVSEAVNQNKPLSRIWQCSRYISPNTTTNACICPSTKTADIFRNTADAA